MNKLVGELMKKNLAIIYLIELFTLIFTLILKFLIMSKFPQYIDISNISFFAVLCLFMIIKLHFPVDKNYKTSSSIRLIIICLFSFVILCYITFPQHSLPPSLFSISCQFCMIFLYFLFLIFNFRSFSFRLW